MTAQLRDTLPHAAQTNSDPCPGSVKAVQLLGRNAPAIVSYGDSRILIITVQTYIHGFAAR